MRKVARRKVAAPHKALLRDKQATSGPQYTYPEGTNVVFVKDYEPMVGEEVFIPAGTQGVVRSIGPDWVEIQLPDDPDVDDSYVAFTNVTLDQYLSHVRKASVRTAKTADITEAVLFESLLGFLSGCNGLLLNMEDFTGEVNEARADEGLMVAPGTDEVMVTLKAAKGHLQQARDVFIEALGSFGSAAKEEPIE